MPITFHPYWRIAVLTAALMTAFKPGQSPPPVKMPILFIEVPAISGSHIL
jgi:hypothetical protein